MKEKTSSVIFAGYIFVMYDEKNDRLCYRSPSARIEWDFSFPSSLLKIYMDAGLPEPQI